MKPVMPLIHRFSKSPAKQVLTFLGVVFAMTVPGIAASTDVTALVTAAVTKDGIALVIGNDRFGDPSPGISKQLHVEYSIGGEMLSLDIPETGKLAIAAPSGQKLTILKAIYGPAAETQEASEATPASAIQVHEGFSVQRVHSVPRADGSWVAMCFDAKGRIYASDQGPRLFRYSPPGIGDGTEGKVEVVSDKWGHSQGMTFINGDLYLVQHGDHSENNFRPESVLRIRDTDGDDTLDKAETLFEFPRVTGDAANWYEHNVHSVVAGPDGQSIYVVSGDRNGLPCPEGRTPKHWNRDSWEFEYTKEPYSGGWVMKADLDGKNPAYLCIGLRNSYDIAFNHHGDLFTFDSDYEGDLGLTNYRPTAIRQILSGTDSGWGGRAGEMRWNWSSKWEDIQPPLKNIGPGSPTGVTFGYGAKFPPRYQEAFFACDWSWGRMFAVHLTPEGSSYAAEVEPFLSAQGLPIADLAVSPVDGALYFLIGGRGTQSGIYRVTYVGNENTNPKPPAALDPATAGLHSLRRELESFHGKPNPAALSKIWPQLSHKDRAIRSAARIALEWQPLSEWQQRALDESNPRTALQSLLALARSTDGNPTVQPALLKALERFDFRKFIADEQCWYLRILTVTAKRHGMFTEVVAAKILAVLEPVLPSADSRVNEEITAMCAALHSNTFLPAALDLLEHSRTQEEQMHYVSVLVNSAGSTGWTAELRGKLFKLATERVPHWKGGASVRPYREWRMNSIIGMLSDDQRRQFADSIARALNPPGIMPAISRNFVKHWKIEDFTAALEAGLKQPRNLENGRTLFTATGCVACHNFHGEGGLAGPDLTSARGRYSARDLLENILNPSKIINEQNAIQIYTMKDGKTLAGRTTNMAGDIIMVATNPMDPGGSEVRFSTKDLLNIDRSPVSFMPPGLLDTLTENDLLDLLAFLTHPDPISPAAVR